MPNLGPLEIAVILILGLLLFGRRLPEVGRNVGRSIIEFKRGLRDVTSEAEAESRRENPYTSAQQNAPKSPPSLSDSDESRTVSQGRTQQPAAQSPADGAKAD